MSVIIGNVVLQWGRNLSVAEGSVRGLAAANGRRLQWGRNLSVAEGGRPPGIVRRGRGASMRLPSN